MIKDSSSKIPFHRFSYGKIRKDWLKRITIRTHDKKTYPHIVGDLFDPADASLLSLTQDPEVIIITEDPVVLAENVLSRKNAIQLIDLLFLLFQENKILKQEITQLLSSFRENRNITKRKASNLKKGMK